MIKEIVHTYALKILGGLINFLFVILISRYLGPEGKGSQGLILTTLTIIILVSSIVGPGGLTYLLPRYHKTDLVFASITWAFIICGISFIFFVLKSDLNIPFLFHIPSLAFLLSLIQIQSAIFISAKQIKLFNWLQFSLSALLLGITFILFEFHKSDLSSYVWAYYASCLLILLTGSIYIYNKNIQIKFKLKRIISSARHIFKYGFFNQIAVLAQTLSFRYSYYIISYQLGEFELGLYSIAIAIIESIWMLSRSIGLVLHSRIINSQDNEKNIEQSLSFLKLSFLINLLIVIVICLLNDRFYTYFFGPEFTGIQSIIIRLSPGVFLFTITFIIGYFFSGIGHHFKVTISSFAGLVFTIIGCHLLIPVFGIHGAAISATVSYTVSACIQIILFMKYSNKSMKSLIINKSDFTVFIALLKKNKL